VGLAQRAEGEADDDDDARENGLARREGAVSAAARGAGRRRGVRHTRAETDWPRTSMEKAMLKRIESERATW
jgi:hypothetical protein